MLKNSQKPIPLIHIIVLNWNGYNDTVECLESLQKVNYPDYKIILIDNGSRDGSVQKLKERFGKDEKIKIIANEENLGFAGGNNVGIEYAMEKGADAVLLINNDTIVDENFLVELVKAAEENKRAGVLGSKIYYESDPKRIWSAGGKVNRLLTKGVHIGYDEIDERQYDEIKKCDYLTGCCLLVKKEVVKKIGVLADDYFLYYEDTDYCLRARKAGYDCLYVPASKIWHKISRSSKPGSSSYIYYHTRNGLTMARRNGSPLIKFLAYPNCLFLFLKQIVKYIFMPAKRKWAIAVLEGERDFLLRRMGRK